MNPEQITVVIDNWQHIAVPLVCIGGCLGFICGILTGILFMLTRLAINSDRQRNDAPTKRQVE